MKEEIFGPVVTIQTFETEEEIQNVMEAYIRAYVDMDFSRIAEKEGKNLTRGHFKRGII